jgi:hypothetical protein
LHLPRRADGARDGTERRVAEDAVRIGEIDGVQRIVRLDPELQPRRRGQLQILEQGQVQPSLIRAPDRVAPDYRGADGIDGLRLERRGVEPLGVGRIADVGVTDEVWTVGPARVGPGRGVRDVDRQARLPGGERIDLPVGEQLTDGAGERPAERQP